MQESQRRITAGYAIRGTLLGLVFLYALPTMAQRAPAQRPPARPSGGQSATDGTEGLGPTETSCTTRTTVTQAPTTVSGAPEGGGTTPVTPPTSRPQTPPGSTRSGPAAPRR
jgi:hypothetical protein